MLRRHCRFFPLTLLLFWSILQCFPNGAFAELLLMGVLPQCYNETLGLSSKIQMASVLNAAACHYNNNESNVETCDYSLVLETLSTACTKSGGIFYQAKTPAVDVTCLSQFSQPVNITFHHLHFGICVGTSCNRLESESLAWMALEDRAKIQGFDKCFTSAASYHTGMTTPAASSSPTASPTILIVPATNATYHPALPPPTIKPAANISKSPPPHPSTGMSLDTQTKNPYDKSAGNGISLTWAVSLAVFAAMTNVM